MDNGVKFALNNIEAGLDAIARNPEFAYLARAVKKERARICSIQKTGDLIRYYSRYSYGSNKHSLDFELLAKASDGQFVPSEKMSEYLSSHYSDEVAHTTDINSFEVGKQFSHDFIWAILGGSYQTSFRKSKDFGVNYILIDSNSSTSNFWVNSNALLYRPTERFVRASGGIDQFADRYRDRLILVFDKGGDNLFTYKGQFRILGTNSNGYIKLGREPYSSTTNWEEPAPLKPSKAIDVNSDALAKASDIMLQRILKDGIEAKVLKQDIYAGMPALFFEFPNGYFEFFGDYDPRTCCFCQNHSSYDSGLFVRLAKNGGLSTNLCFFEPESDFVFTSSAASRTYGWGSFDEDWDDYDPVYSDRLKKLANGQKICINGARFVLTYGKNDASLLPLFERFILIGISRDHSVLSLENDVSELSAGQMLSQVSSNGDHFDLALFGYYSRIAKYDPVFIIGAHRDNLRLIRSRRHLLGGKSNVVFVNLYSPRTEEVLFEDRTYLVLGIDFVNRLSRIYSDIAAQYLWPMKLAPENEGDYVLCLNSEDELGSRTVAYKAAVEKNEEELKVAVGREPNISIILGNGVSIPFGSEPWDDLIKNLIKQLQPRFIESASNVDEFLGKIGFSTTDFSKEMLEEYKYNDQYWKALNYSIYRRFNKDVLDTDTAIKAVAEAKHAHWRQLTLFTYNYDVFLEEQYKRLYSANLLSMTDKEIAVKGTSNPNCVYHLHGVLSEKSLKGQEIILSSSSYFAQYAFPYKSAKMKYLLKCLQSQPCLFIGSSMTDIFQMDMLSHAGDSATKNNPTRIYALLCLSKLGDKEKETVYRYFLKKGVRIISFDAFKNLPDRIRTIFGLPLIKKP